MFVDNILGCMLLKLQICSAKKLKFVKRKKLPIEKIITENITQPNEEFSWIFPVRKMEIADVDTEGSVIG